MNANGKAVEENNAYGYNKTNNVTDPDWVLVMDEVGGNTSQKGDGKVGEELQLRERGKVATRTINTKDKHHTLLSITAIYGKPIICILIFTRESPRILADIGLYLDAEMFESPDKDDFFAQNSGPGKCSPPWTDLLLQRCGYTVSLPMEY